MMRDDKVVPKDVIRRYTELIRWDLDPAERRLMAVCDSLERADKLVLYESGSPKGYWNGPPNPHPAG